MKQYTFSQIDDAITRTGNYTSRLLRSQALGIMMDSIEEDTGKFPAWDDIAPEWIVNQFASYLKGV